ncbi:MAG: formylglycine-generating enzyme family protein, partial [Cytophagales bacterium]|nr:formylglycine-generating enzyme family protein [Cytophagales bacterium]
ARHEVTNNQYAQFLNAQQASEEQVNSWINLKGQDCQVEKIRNHYRAKPGFEQHPLVTVSWYGAQDYCQWAGGQLPSEAQWEFAAQGGKRSQGYTYAGSNNPDEVAWYSSNSGGQTHPVGQKKPNELGLYDMSGNGWEWCSDWYSSDYYKNSPQNNPQGPSNGSRRVVRGGSWLHYPEFCRVALRNLFHPGYRYGALGFRLARTL